MVNITIQNKVGKYNNTKCIYFQMDSTDPQQVTNSVKNILTQFSRIDILGMSHSNALHYK